MPYTYRGSSLRISTNFTLISNSSLLGCYGVSNVKLSRSYQTAAVSSSSLSASQVSNLVKHYSQLKLAKLALVHLKVVNAFKVTTECPTRYRTRHFFNNSNTNEDIAKKFEQEYVRCVRNE